MCGINSVLTWMGLAGVKPALHPCQLQAGPCGIQLAARPDQEAHTGSSLGTGVCQPAREDIW